MSARRLQALILVLVLATVTVGAVALALMERHFLTATGETLALAASDIADKLDLLLYERTGDLSALAKTAAILLERGDRAALTSYLAAMQQAYPLYLWIGVTDERGRIIASTDAVSVGRDRSDRPWFQAVRDGTALVIEDPSRSREAGHAAAFAYSAPVTGGDGRLLGVVSTRVSLAAMTDLFSRTLRLIMIERGFTTSPEWELLAKDGAILDESLPPEQAPVNLPALGVASARLSLDPDRAAGFIEEEHARRRITVVTGYAHTEGYGRFESPLLGVLVRLDREQVLAPIRTRLWKAGAAGALVVLPLLALTLWATRHLHRAWREAAATSEEVRRLNAELEQRVDEATAQLRAANVGLEEQLRLQALAGDVAAALTADTDGFQGCAEAIVRHLGAAFARIWTLDPAEDVLILRASAGMYTNIEGRHYRVPVGQFKIGLIAQERKPHLTNQVIGDPRVHDQDWARREGLVSFAGYPLLLGDRVVGVMAMFARHPLSQDVLHTMEAIALGIAQFIERKRAEEELRRAKMRFQALVETTSDWIWEVDREGIYTYISPRVTAILGYEPRDLLGKTPFAFMPPEEAERVSALFRTFVAARIPFSGLENTNLHRDGHEVVLESSGVPVLDEAGHVVGYRGIDRDITGRKRTEEALRTTEERFRTFMANSPSVAFLKDEEGRHVFVNRAMERIFSLEEATWKGKTNEELWPADIARHLSEHDRIVLAEDRVSETVETVPTPDGRRLDWLVVKFPVTDGAGRRFVGGLGIDITERKRAEEELAQSRAMLRLIMDNIPQRVFWKDRALTYLGCNDAFARAAGLKRPEDVVGRNDFDLPWSAQAEGYRADDRAVMEAAVPKLNFEEPYVDTEGTPRTARTSKVPLRDSAGSVFGILGIFEDVTEHKALEAHSRRLERLATLGQLVGGIAHELKNPLFILTGQLQLCGEKLRHGERTSLAGDLAKLEATAARLTRITERFLALARPVEHRPESCLVSMVLSRTLEFFANELMRNQIAVRTDVPSDLPPVWADPRQLQEVFMNLILNAIQAMAAAHGRGTLTVHAKLSAASDQPSASESTWIEVRITDDGPGIAPEHRSRLFEPFFSTKAPEQGAGMGLWTIRMTLMQLHGSITCETEVGRGSTFIVRLPVMKEIAEIGD